MRELTPTRSTTMELADERKLMRQGYEFLDEKRMLLAAEILRQLRIYQERAARLMAEVKSAADVLAAAVERHGLDQLQIYPVPMAPATLHNDRVLFLGLPMLSCALEPQSVGASPAAIDPSPEAKACAAAFQRLLRTAADLGTLAGNLHRLAREYRRTERRAKALEKVLLPEVEDGIKRIDEQLDAMEREESIRNRWSDKVRRAE
jgi:V/A-type H+/Na+-transporting ATPase subunit D